MSRGNKSRDNRSVVSDVRYSVAEGFRTGIILVLFFILLTVVSVASFISIRWVSPAVHLDTQFGSSYDLTYACVLGVLILFVSGFSFIVSYRARGLDRFGLLLRVSIFVLFLGVLISVVFACDKSVALYSGSGLVIGFLVMISAYRLSDAPWKINLAIILLISLGATFALKVWIRELYEIDQTWKHYMQSREDFWSSRGKSLDSPEVKLFEARLKSRDNGGFFFHGNLGGAYLAVVFLVSLSFVSRRIRERIAGKEFSGLWLLSSILISGFIFSGLLVTRSKSGILACILSLMIVGCIWLFRGILSRHFRLAVAIFVFGVSIVAMSVVWYGVSKGTLPGLSMAYRWEYWQASWKMFKDYYLTGVGPGNFGYYYLRYKLPCAEEEVLSPHNFIVQGFTELGVLGGLGLLLFVVGLFYGLGRVGCLGFATGVVGKEGCIGSEQKRENGFADAIGQERVVRSMSAISVMLILLCLVFGVIFIFNQSGLPGLIYLIAEWLPYIFCFGFVFVLCCFSGDRIERIFTDISYWDRLFLSSALIAFVLSNITNFSFFEPSTQILFFFVAGVSLSCFYELGKQRIDAGGQEGDVVKRKGDIRECKQSGSGGESGLFGKKFDFLGSKVKVVVGVLILLIVVLVYCYYLVRPAMLAEGALRRTGDSSGVLSIEYDDVYRTFVELTGEYWYDAHMPKHAGNREVVISRSSYDCVSLLKEAIGWYDLAYRRAGVLWKVLADEAHCYLLLAKLEGDKKMEYFRRAEELLERARRIAPLSRTLAMETGLTYYEHIRLMNNPRSELVRRAYFHLSDAIRLNDALPAGSLRRYSKEDMARIRSALEYVLAIERGAKGSGG